MYTFLRLDLLLWAFEGELLVVEVIVDGSWGRDLAVQGRLLCEIFGITESKESWKIYKGSNPAANLFVNLIGYAAPMVSYIIYLSYVSVVQNS